MISKTRFFTFLLFAFLLQALGSPLLVREVGDYSYVDRFSFTTFGDVKAAPNRGWRVSGVNNYEYASESWFIRKLTFYVDGSCTDPMSVSNYEYIVPFSSHGNAMNAFDGSSWRIPSSYSNIEWDIGFYFTEEEFPPPIRCVEIFFENEDPMVTTTNMEIALEKLYQPDSYSNGFSSPQEHEWKLLYEVRGLKSATNTIAFSETCITSSDVSLSAWGDSICDEEFNHATCLYDDGDCDGADESSSITTSLLSALFAVLGFITAFELIRRHNQRHNGQSQPVTLSAPAPAVQNVNEDREARRERILLNIIHKQVLSQSSKENQSSIENDNLSTTEQDHEKEEEEEGEEKAIAEPTIILPHEESLSSRYLRAAPKTDEEAQTPISTASDDSVVLKDDLYVKSLRSLRENSSRIVVNNDVEDSLYSPKVCPICCEEYKKGDDIAWSKNESCYHAYHVDCIMEWLMDHDDCPLCREKYIEL